MKNIFLLVMFASLLLLASCGRKPGDSASAKFAASSPVVGSIISELTRGVSEVVVILPPGASPHTYSPSVSDVQKASSALAIFYADENADAWAAKLSPDKAVRLLAFLNPDSLLHFEDDHDCADHETATAEEHKQEISGIDPHFWTDPLTVKSIVGSIADKLSALDPSNSEKYKQNAARFSSELDSLDAHIGRELASYKGRKVFLFHPSFLYLFRRYGLEYGGSVEVSPGKEPSPKYIAELVEKLRASSTKIIYSEPQLPSAPAKVIAESAGVGLLELDPTGGIQGRIRYVDIIRYNIDALVKGFK